MYLILVKWPNVILPGLAAVPASSVSCSPRRHRLAIVSGQLLAKVSGGRWRRKRRDPVKESKLKITIVMLKIKLPLTFWSWNKWTYLLRNEILAADWNLLNGDETVTISRQSHKWPEKSLLKSGIYVCKGDDWNQSFGEQYEYNLESIGFLAWIEANFSDLALGYRNQPNEIKSCGS